MPMQAGSDAAEQQWTAHTPTDLDVVASALLMHCKPGNVIGLTGELGMGKTTLVQALCRQLQVNDIVTSPSFAYIHTYTGINQQGMSLPILHADLYRAEPVERIVPELLATIMEQQALLLMEWPERWPEGEPWLTHRVVFSPGEGSSRVITLSLLS
jgi:tRNA threonylcarbamoyladenosine biosynthesis protein TsaE